MSGAATDSATAFVASAPSSEQRWGWGHASTLAYEIPSASRVNVIMWPFLKYTAQNNRVDLNRDVSSVTYVDNETESW